MVHSLRCGFGIGGAGFRETGFQFFDVYVLKNGSQQQMLDNGLLVVGAGNVLAVLALQSGNAHFFRVG